MKSYTILIHACFVLLCKPILNVFFYNFFEMEILVVDLHTCIKISYFHFNETIYKDEVSVFDKLKKTFLVKYEKTC